MTDLDLDAIEARADAATQGPWEVESYRDGTMSEATYRILGIERFREYVNDVNLGTDQATAKFIAHAREDVPALVARIRELESEKAADIQWPFPSATKYPPTPPRLTTSRGGFRVCGDLMWPKCGHEPRQSCCRRGKIASDLVGRAGLEPATYGL